MSSDNVPNKDETQTEAASANADAASGTETAETIITAEQFAELQAKAAKADETWDRYVRLNADFDNFRKRAARDREDGMRSAQERLLNKLLPVIDNFDMAMAATTSAQNTTVESLKAGVQMIQGQLKGVLTDSGVEEIDAMGKPFDPNLHEALSQLESADAPEGTVLQQLRKGYKMRDRLLRPASVVVAKKPATESTEAKS
jgi:molecular chaperone GrpE